MVSGVVNTGGMMKNYTMLVGAVMIGAVGAAVYLSAPAHADTTDTAFLLTLKSAGVPYDSGKDMIVEANAACFYMSDANGGTFAGEVKFLLEHHPDWTPENMGTFLGAANRSYCKDENLIPGGVHTSSERVAHW